MVEPLHSSVLSPRRIAAVQDDVVGVGQVVLVRRHHDVRVIAVGEHAQSLGLERPAAERLDLSVVDRATDEREHGGSRRPAPAIHDHAVLAVLGVHALELVGHVRERLVPADALPLVLAAEFAMGVLATTRLPALALHGVLDTVGVVDLLAQRASAQAAALLRLVEAVLVRVVRLLADDHAVDHVAAVHAHLVAVLMAVDGQPFAALFQDGVIGRHGGRSLPLVSERSAGKPQRSSRGSRARAGPQEASATHAVVKDSHALSPLVLHEALLAGPRFRLHSVRAKRGKLMLISSFLLCLRGMRKNGAGEML